MPSDQDSVELAIAVQTLAARQAVHGIALRALVEELTADQAARCAVKLRARVNELVESQLVTAIPQADEALSEELGRLLDVLKR